MVEEAPGGAVVGDLEGTDPRRRQTVRRLELEADSQRLVRGRIDPGEVDGRLARADGAAATCSPVTASRRRGREPEPPPPGEKTFIVAVRLRQAVTARPGDGPIEVDTALPVGEKLTGACVISTFSSAGLPSGPERRAANEPPGR